MRTEKDFLGTVEIESGALYGIHSARARQNFLDATPFHKEWYEATGLTKLAVYETYANFKEAILKKYPMGNIPLQLMDDETLRALMLAATEVAAGKHFGHFIVPAVQGGAGTSINLNINEIIANAALRKTGKNHGDYAAIDPIEHANIYQSTNDVIPTALKVAAMKLLNGLEESINRLRAEIEIIEKNHRNTLRIAYTQMQEAVPSSYGRLFSAYNEALSRDWWRVSKCFERIKVVNLGSSAVGTGITVPRYMVMESARTLARITGLPITRGENLSDATSNLDSFVEVHAILKSHAVNLEKMCNDIRLLASDISGGELSIPKKQAGSSIMPGKVNPVIIEFVISSAHIIYANDSLIANLSAQGCLELNAYLPVIGHKLLESLKLLIACNSTLKDNLFSGLEINAELSREKLFRSPSLSTALLPYTGYHKSGELAKEMKEKSIDIFEANRNLKLVPDEKLSKILSTENLLKEGFTINDLENNG